MKKEYTKPRIIERLEILVEMTPKEQKEQAVNFVYGNLNSDGSKATKKQISDVYDSMHGDL